jgi:hypothetical protein
LYCYWLSSSFFHVAFTTSHPLPFLILHLCFSYFFPLLLFVLLLVLLFLFSCRSCF